MRRLNIFVIVLSLMFLAAGVLPAMAIASSESQSSIEQTFQQAKKNYLAKNMNAAAQQIQKSASYMKEKSKEASAKGKETMNASAKELEKLAGDVKKGTVTSVKRMEETFARAYVALALDSHIKSTESWAKKEKVKTGDALESANEYMDKSFTWAGRKIETGTKEVMKKSRDLSQKLKKKGSVIAEDVGKGLKATGDEIEKFGKNISSK